MKLFYYQRSDGIENFGDRLNFWLWPQLLPGILDNDEIAAFIGFGTLLNNLLQERVPQAKQLAIFSTGVGYEQPLTHIPERWKIYCVRGFLSAKQLGLPEKLAVTDGAILARRLFKPTAEKKRRFAFMPHIHHARFASTAWQEICQHIGFQYIDPRWSVEQVLTTISQTEILLAEAMHGAVVADALRVPWIPVTTSPRILSFKWQDWCSSIGLDYKPYYVAPLSNFYPRYGRGLRSSLAAMQHWGNYTLQNRFGNFARLRGKAQQFAADRVLHIARTARPNLSADKQLEQLTVELEERLEQFKTHAIAGKFASDRQSR
jgi:succinoglycan biosynthesis protein ExoV